MFDISLAELLFIVVVAVVFIGPKELPAILRSIAKAVRALKHISHELRKTFDTLAEESGLSSEIKMIQGDDGQWYESYPTEIPPTSTADTEAKDT